MDTLNAMKEDLRKMITRLENYRASLDRADPNGRRVSIAITEVETAMLWINAVEYGEI